MNHASLHDNEYRLFENDELLEDFVGNEFVGDEFPGDNNIVEDNKFMGEDKQNKQKRKAYTAAQWYSKNMEDPAYRAEMQRRWREAKARQLSKMTEEEMEEMRKKWREAKARNYKEKTEEEKEKLRESKRKKRKTMTDTPLGGGRRTKNRKRSNKYKTRKHLKN